MSISQNTTAIPSPCRWLWLSLIIVVCGCGAPNTSPATVEGLIISGPDPLSKTAASNLDPSLTHDFGVVRPGETFSHTFTIRNPSSATWTIAQLKPSCSCTVSRASARTIPPGGSADIEVTYRAPRADADDRRSVAVFFQKGVDPVVLWIAAKARAPLSATTPSLDFLKAARGSTPEGTFEVYNYSDRTFVSIKLLPSVPWLRTECHDLKLQPIAGGRRQGWRVGVRLDTNDLVPGTYRGEVVVESGGPGDRLRAVVEVHLSLISPVEAVPSQMFFGTVEPGRAAKQTTLLRFAPGVAPPDPATCKVSHDLGERFHLERSTSSKGFWTLTGSLAPGDGDEDRVVAGTVDVRFESPLLPRITIPVSARVRKP